MVHIPGGGIKKIPLSISFAKMDEMQFRDVYKSVFNVCWNLVLRRSFETEEAAQNAIDILHGYI